MKRKSKEPIPEPADWHLESQVMNNARPARKPINSAEEATIKAGGEEGK